MTFPSGGSEYGGYPGLIQPAPHDPEDSSAEMATLTVRSDPDDEASGPLTVAEADRVRGKERLGK